MTAASYTTRSFALPARTMIRFRRVLAALGVCLPVPICAVSGLSLPLPSTVERISAALVPWVDAVAMSANEALRPGAAGTIVRTDAPVGGGDQVVSAAEVTKRSGQGTSRVRVVVPRPAGRTVHRRGESTLVAATTIANVPSSPTEGGTSAPAQSVREQRGEEPKTTAAPEQAASPSPTTSSPAPAPTPTPTTPSQPEPAPPPRQNDPDPVAPVKETVNEVAAPVTPIVETTKETVNETAAPVTELLPGIGK